MKKSICKTFEFDAAHRIMDEGIKCFNLHGHRFKVDVAFTYERTSDIGYALDFKKLNEELGGFIDKYLDHAAILNPSDEKLITLCKCEGWKYFLANYCHKGDDYMNPTAENIAEIIYAVADRMFVYQQKEYGLKLDYVRVYETPTCWAEYSE